MTDAGPADLARAPRASGVGPRRRWLRRGLFALAIALAVAAGFVAWALLTCFAAPPPLPDPSPPLLAASVATDAAGRRHLGPCWFEPRPGASVMHLEGSPLELGFANASLTADLLAQQERSLHATVERAIPSSILRTGLAFAVLVNNRSLPGFVPDEYRREIHGLSLADIGEDPFTWLGSRYHRLLNYHAAHDISHWVWDQPVLGCSAFAAAGARTAHGHLLIGRNFDWESGEHFDRNKVIAHVRPQRGHAFLSVSWPGMAGAVTGINAARIFCSINGAHSQDKGRIGRPVSLVVREVLQYADSLASAIDIVAKAPVFVADSFLIADGETGEAAVVEKTPARHAVRAMRDGLLLQANHFECPEFAADTGNVAYRRDGSSEPRRTRLQELLDARAEPLDPAAAVAILRDRLGPGGALRALGHRATLNPDIATHSVVADATAGILWVSCGPHQAGEFAAYGFADFPRPAAPPIPADPALADGRLQALAAQRRAYDAVHARQHEAGVAATDVAELEQALQGNPGSVEVLFLLGRTLARLGRTREAAVRFEQALAGAPPYRPLQVEIEAALRALPPRTAGEGSPR